MTQKQYSSSITQIKLMLLDFAPSKSVCGSFAKHKDCKARKISELVLALFLKPLPKDILAKRLGVSTKTIENRIKNSGGIIAYNKTRHLCHISKPLLPLLPLRMAAELINVFSSHTLIGGMTASISDSDPLLPIDTASFSDEAKVAIQLMVFSGLLETQIIETIEIAVKLGDSVELIFASWIDVGTLRAGEGEESEEEVSLIVEEVNGDRESYPVSSVISISPSSAL